MNMNHIEIISSVFKHNITIARENKELGNQPGASSQWARGDELETRIYLMALEFAAQANINQMEFLVDCGIVKK